MTGKFRQQHEDERVHDDLDLQWRPDLQLVDEVRHFEIQVQLSGPPLAMNVTHRKSMTDTFADQIGGRL